MIKAEDVVEAVHKHTDLIIDGTGDFSNTNFKTLGLDSLDVFNVLLELEDKTKKSVADEDVESLTSIMDVLNYFNQD